MPKEAVPQCKVHFCFTSKEKGVSGLLQDATIINAVIGISVLG
jgi:hypothetical protein